VLLTVQTRWGVFDQFVVIRQVERGKGNVMLTLTDDARTAIQSLTSTPDSPPEAGVRIAAAVPANGAAPELALGVAAAPEPGDQVVDDAGARLFLEPVAASSLEDQTLDARIDMAEQKIDFFLA
jgi:iron-sulfur cluster assembly protein